MPATDRLPPRPLPPRLRFLHDGSTASLLSAAVAGCAAVLFLVFVIGRALFVSLTYDEAATYTRYISTGFLSVFSFSVATNHPLNTLLARLCYSVGGGGELALRLPNVVAFAIYLLFAWKMLSRLRHRIVAAAGFVLINLNSYLLEYFALCRGYGLSLGLLMASLYFLVKFVDAGTPAPLRANVWRSLVLAGAAAAASFPSLTVFLALWGIWCLVLLERSRPAGTLAPSAAVRAVRAHVGRGRAVSWALFTVVFTALCASQDTALSPLLYEPVSVSVAGLSESELQAVKVSRVNLRGRSERLARHGTFWQSADRNPFTGLRIDIPRSAAESQGLIQVAMGRERFTHRLTGRDSTFLTIGYSGSFQALEALPALATPRSRLAVFAPIRNWSGDRALFGAVVISTCVWIGLLLVLVATFALALVVLTRWRGGMQDYVAPLLWTPAWVAAAVGYPLWLLFRNGELYYGGTRGLVADTFTSLVDGFLYVIAARREEQFMLAGLGVALIGVLAMMAVRARRHGLRSVSAPLWLFLLLALVAIGIELEHRLFDARFPTGRTALFFFPLLMWPVVLGIDAACGAGRVVRACATAVLLLATGLAGWHFGRVANLTHVFDWSGDAYTRSVVDEVRRVAMEGPARPGSVSLGVDASFLPAAVYYAERPGYPVVHVEVMPASRPLDFLYARAPAPDMDGDIIRQFPSGAVLVRRRAPR